MGRRALDRVTGAFAAAALLPLPLAFADGLTVGYVEFLIGAGCAVGILALALVLPWRRLPAWTPVILPIGYLGVVDLLRATGGGFASGYSPLLLLPVLWLALYRSRSELLAGLIALAVA